MELNEYQNRAMTTCMPSCDNVKTKTKVTVKGSYFPGEVYAFDDSKDNLPEFVKMLKSRGCYISDDGHIRSKKGGLMSKLTRNGYWLTAAAFNKKTYYFCEHRVVWCWYNGAIPNGEEINHIDYNRGNNHIENLEVVTHSENMQHSKEHFNPCIGEKSNKTTLTNKQAEAIKTICGLCGWMKKDAAQFFNVSPITASRVCNGTRFPNVIERDSILSVYPTFVDFTRNKSIGEIEELKDYVLGLNGEVGELTDLVKKILYHGKEYNPTELILELGDIFYYITAIMLVLGIDASEVLLNNNAKLLSRYPNGFDKDKSENRIEDKLASRKQRGVIDGNGDNR